MKSAIKSNNTEENIIKHFAISKSRQCNYRDLLNEWNQTPPKEEQTKSINSNQQLKNKRK